MRKNAMILGSLLAVAACGGTPPADAPPADATEPDLTESAPSESALSEMEQPPIMTAQARGTFDVDLTPRSIDGPTFQAGVASMSITKVLKGDLEGTSVGEMLSFRSEVDGSAGYVALEMVTGTLEGRSGSFMLQHSSTMDRNAPAQSIVVVPDSGTGELEGISGDFRISIVEGQHRYEFDYALPAR